MPASGIFVGAYAASPAHAIWNPALEEAYFDGLDGHPGIRGLELPWLGGLHPHDDEWLLDHLPRRFDLALTDIGATVGAAAEDQSFGLASRDNRGRRAALNMAMRLRDDVARLTSALGRRAVVAVELHSAPLAHGGSPDALARSLVELAVWDWSGAQLLIEHCDAEVPGQTPAKGYLTLESELAAIREADVGIRMSLNWGRSAIELRDADQVTDHIELVAASGLLSGLMLSGAGGTAGPFGAAWADAHHPFARSGAFPLGDDSSELTLERAAAALAGAGDLDWLGIKMGFRPADAGVTERLAMVSSAVDVTVALLDATT